MFFRKVLSLVAAWGLALVLAGCQEASQGYQFRTVRNFSTAISEPVQYIAGKSVEGRNIGCVVFGSGGNPTLVMAAIHGNEQGGIGLVENLDRYLRENPYKVIGKKIILLAVANPDGVIANSRRNVHGIDINRNFKTSNRVNNSINGLVASGEPETIAIQEILRKYQPTRIISIHSPLACIDYDGPGRYIAQKMARLCDLPVKKLGSRPGSLGSYAGIELGVPIITFELSRADEKLSKEQLWKKYKAALLAGI